MTNYRLCQVMLHYQPSKSDVQNFHSSYIFGCVLNSFLSYTATMLNIATIYAVRKTSTLSLPQPLKTLLLSLAVSDLGVGLLCQPFFITLLVKWLQQDNPSCTVYAAFTTILSLFSFASFFGVMVLSIDRFMAIYLHLRHQELVTHNRVVAVVISIWVISAFLALITLWVPTDISFVLFAIIEISCLVTSTFLNFKIYSAVRRHRNQIQALQVQQVAQNGEMINAASISKTALGTFYVYLVFLLCFLPQICTYAAIAISEISPVVKRFSMYTLTIVFLNSSLNPVIYCWKMRHIRRTIIGILRNALPKNAQLRQGAR
ncbi:adenosine receptor A2a-like [Oculina patagonica]